MQKQWLIDAHNLMHLIPPVTRDYSNNRLDGIGYLTTLVDSWCMNLKRKALLVFDGHPLHLGMKFRYCRVAFSGGKTADEAIINRLNNRSASNWIVISNDREVLSQARLKGAETQTADTFLNQFGSKGSAGRQETPTSGDHPLKQADVDVSDNEVEEMLRLFNKSRND